MRTKKRGLITTVIALLGICLLGILLLFVVPTADTTTASAAETPKYSMYFDYKWYSGGYLDKLENPSKTGSNVLKTEKLNCTRNVNTTCELAFELYGSSHTTATDVFAQGGTIKSNGINITSNSGYDDNAYQITNSSGVVVASSRSKTIQATLADGTYYVTFTGEAEWVYEGPIRDTPRAIRIVCTFYFKIETHTHSYTATVTQATCTTGGYTTYKCSCGDTYTGNQTSALGHSYSATTMSATCTSGGYTTYRCTRCSYTYTGNQTSALGHSYVSTTTAATCTTGGYTTHKCSRCSSSYVDNQVEALGHSYTLESSITCTGEKFVYTCSRCNYSYTETTTENGAGHSFTTKTTAATCTNDGYTVYTCTKCGYSYQDTVANALGHSYTFSVVSATCTSGGYTLFSCSRCGNEYRSGSTQPSGHSYISRSFPATCTEGSYTLHECSRCGDSYRDNISQPLGHNFITSEIPATCLEGGKTVTKCQVCNYETSESDGSLPTGHDYTNTVVKAATCTGEGIRRSVCDTCGYSFEARVAALGHSYEITDVQSANGITKRTYTCSACGDRYTQELGNQYEEVTNYVEYLFEQYSPYMFWVFLATAGVWSIAMGVALIIAHKNEDKEKAKKMLINYVIGLVVIAVILVACPYLVRGIAALVT